MKNATHEVLRPIPGPGGRIYQPRERVDASGWRNAAALTERRYLRPLTYGESVDAKPKGKEVSHGSIPTV